MMAMKMNTVNDEDLIRAAFRAIDKKGTGTISTDVFRFLLTNIGDNKLSDSEVGKKKCICSIALFSASKNKGVP